MSLMMCVFLLLVSLDQISKWWAQQAGLVTWNEGIAFGLGQGRISQAVVTLGLTLVLFIAWRVVGQISTKNSLPGTFILAGAFSNLIDRILFGAVRDWLPVPLMGLQNNMADWLIAAGVILLIKELFLTTASSKNA